MGLLLSRERREHNSITDNDRALLALKVSRSRVVKHRNSVLRTAEQALSAARQHCAEGDRPQARDALRRRRYWAEVALDQADAMLQQIDAVVAGVEMAQLNQEVYDGLAAGTAALKRMQSDLSLDNVEALMDERADALAVQRAIDAALGADADLELEDELTRLESEALVHQLPSAPTESPRHAPLPSPPQSAIVIADSDGSSRLRREQVASC